MQDEYLKSIIYRVWTMEIYSNGKRWTLDIFDRRIGMPNMDIHVYPVNILDMKIYIYFFFFWLLSKYWF